MKKSYAKIKSQELAAAQPAPLYSTGEIAEKEDGDNNDHEPAGLELHPDRQAMVESAEQRAVTGEDKQQVGDGNRDRKRRRPKPAAFAREMNVAQKRNEEIETKRKSKETREKDRLAMTKARKPDQFGKKRLGRESKVLLGRVKRLTYETT